MLEFLKKKLKKKTPVVAVVAMSRMDRGIGFQNDLLWHIPDDLKRFKQLTNGYPVIMGRKTFESILEILGKPLPNRTNIVVTRDKEYTRNGAVVAHSLEEALEKAEQENAGEIHIGGGAELYRQALPFITRLYVTWIDERKQADTFFPPFETEFKVVETHESREHENTRYQWIDYRRK